MATRELKLTATTDDDKVFKDAEYVIISTPTNYDPDKNYFDIEVVVYEPDLAEEELCNSRVINDI